MSEIVSAVIMKRLEAKALSCTSIQCLYYDLDGCHYCSNKAYSAVRSITSYSDLGNNLPCSVFMTAVTVGFVRSMILPCPFAAVMMRCEPLGRLEAGSEGRGFGGGSGGWEMIIDELKH